MKAIGKMEKSLPADPAINQSMHNWADDFNRPGLPVENNDLLGLNGGLPRNSFPKRVELDAEEFTSDIMLPTQINQSEKMAILRRASNSFDNQSIDVVQLLCKSTPSTLQESGTSTVRGPTAVERNGHVMKDVLTPKQVYFSKESSHVLMNIDSHTIPQTPAIKSAKRSRVKNQHPRPELGARTDQFDRMQEENYRLFKTKSRKHERQTSHSEFRKLQQEGDHINITANELSPLSAERFFDALKGPELEILKVVRLNFFRGFPFSITWWAFLYPMTSAAIATIHYSHKVNHFLTKALAATLSIVSAITVFGLFLSTVFHGVFLDTLFPNDIAIAIRHERKQQRTKNNQDSLSKTSINSLLHASAPSF